MENLFFDGETHTYYYKGDKVPCVSDILKMVDVITMVGIPIRNLEAAAERGTRVHQETEKLDYGEIDPQDEAWLQENADIAPYVIGYQNFLSVYPTLPIAREEALYSKHYRYAGTLDLVKFIDGKIAIVDIKTSKTISELRSSLQLNAYRLLWNETHPDMQADDLYILQLDGDNGYRLFKVEVDAEQFYDVLILYKKIKGDRKL